MAVTGLPANLRSPIAGEIGRMAVTLDDLDAVVFTAGIGEHQPEIRASVAKRLSWLGLAIDEKANAANVIADEALSILATG